MLPALVFALRENMIGTGGILLQCRRSRYSIITILLVAMVVAIAIVVVVVVLGRATPKPHTNKNE